MSENSSYTPSAETLEAFTRLAEVVSELRDKCPWDREQTKESLRHLTIEETYELAEAILDDDYDEMRVELGDLLLHVLFYSRIAEQEGHFDIADVMRAQTEKLIRRHPHIYADLDLRDADAVTANWERIKAQERKGKKQKSGTLDGVPAALPALIQAMRMQEKAAKVGFDWDEKSQVWDKVKEEVLEFEEASASGDKAEMEAEMGDLLFALVNYCRFADINPADALARTNHKFRHRFAYIEAQAEKQQKAVGELSLDDMEFFWQEAKK